MTTRLKIYIAIAIVILGLGIYLGAKAYIGEMKRMESNYLAALEQVRSENKESLRVLTLSVSEVKRQYPEIKQALGEMDIKLKNVEIVQNVNTTTTNQVNTVLRDSTINDTTTVRIARYNDKWIDFKLTNINDSIWTSITTRDSLFIVLHKQRRSLGQWLRGEPRAVTSTIKNYNPNSKITYNRLIKIK